MATAQQWPTRRVVQRNPWGLECTKTIEQQVFWLLLGGLGEQATSPRNQVVVIPFVVIPRF